MNTLNENFLFIPTQVRYCNSLPPNAKLLFGEIANRANEEGKALFLYDELPEFFNVNKKAVYMWIKDLEEAGFITSKMLRIKRVHYHAFELLLKPQPKEETTSQPL